MSMSIACICRNLFCVLHFRQLNKIYCQRTSSILAVHVVEDAGSLLPVVVVIDGDQGVLGLLDGHHVLQIDVNTSLLAAHVIEI